MTKQATIADLLRSLVDGSATSLRDTLELRLVMDRGYLDIAVDEVVPMGVLYTELQSHSIGEHDAAGLASAAKLFVDKVTFYEEDNLADEDLKALAELEGACTAFLVSRGYAVEKE